MASASGMAAKFPRTMPGRVLVVVFVRDAALTGQKRFHGRLVVCLGLAADDT